MSINKELKFTKWYENHVVGKHEDAPYNYFMDDEWFDSLPNELKKSIIKVNEKSYDDDSYEALLNDLEVEIKYYIFDNCNGNYDDETVEYLWEYHDYYVEKWNNY